MHYKIAMTRKYTFEILWNCSHKFFGKNVTQLYFAVLILLFMKGFGSSTGTVKFRFAVMAMVVRLPAVVGMRGSSIFFASLNLQNNMDTHAENSLISELMILSVNYTNLRRGNMLW